MDGFFGPDGIERDFSFEDVPIQEEQGRKCLILGAGCDLSLGGQVGEILCDLAIIEVAGVNPASPLLSEEGQKVLDPIDVGRFRAFGHMANTDRMANLVQ